MSDAEKAALRRTLRAARRAAAGATEPTHRAAAAADLAVQALALLGQLGPADRPLVVAAFESTPTEPPTETMIERLVAAGHRVIVPITLADLDLSWAQVGDRRDLGTDAIATADLVLVPALAVDASGTRLGQGGGSYDRALVRLGHRTPVVAVLHPGEYLTERHLPRHGHDRPVDAVLTRDGLTLTTSASGSASTLLPHRPPPG